MFNIHRNYGKFSGHRRTGSAYGSNAIFAPGIASQFFFDRGQYMVDGSIVSQASGVDPSFTRSTSRYVQSAGGVWSQKAINVPPIVPSVGYRGRESWTNTVPSPTFSGAGTGVIGSGGTVGTGQSWNSGTGITREVLAVTTLNGIPAVTLKISGTNPTGGTVYPDYYFTGVGSRPTAVSGETWTAQVEYRIDDATDTSGFITYPLHLGCGEFASGGSYLAATTTALSGGVGVSTRTFNNASTAYAGSYINFSIAAGGTVDFTITVAAPQLIKKPYTMPFSDGATAADALVFNAADLGMDVVPSSTGVTIVWRGTVYESAASNHRAIEVAVDQNNRLSLLWSDSAGAFFGTRASGGSFPGADLGGALNTELTASLTWRSDGSFRCYRSWDSGDINDTQTPMAGTAATCSIGNQLNGGNISNNDTKAAMFHPAGLSDGDLLSLHNRVAA